MPTQPTDFKKKSSKKTKKSVSSPSDFRKSTKKIFDVELPSGNVVQLRRVDLPSMLAEGILPDSLMGIVQGKLGDAKANPDIDDSKLVEDMVGDTDKIADIFSAFDSIVVRTVVQPKVRLHTNDDGETIPDEDRDEDFVYTDEVELNDKIFIFQYSVGGDADLESFRAKSGSAVADLEDVAKLQETP